jgi:hypothetical protein
VTSRQAGLPGFAAMLVAENWPTHHTLYYRSLCHENWLAPDGERLCVYGRPGQHGGGLAAAGGRGQWRGAVRWIPLVPGTGPTASNNGPLGSQPTVGVDGAGNEYVFWEQSGPGRGLEEIQRIGSSWGGAHAVNGGMGPLGSSPTVAVAPGGSQYVFWNGPIDRGDGPLG